MVIARSGATRTRKKPSEGNECCSGHNASEGSRHCVHGGAGKDGAGRGDVCFGVRKSQGRSSGAPTGEKHSLCVTRVSHFQRE